MYFESMNPVLSYSSIKTSHKDSIKIPGPKKPKPPSFILLFICYFPNEQKTYVHLKWDGATTLSVGTSHKGSPHIGFLPLSTYL